MSDILIKNMKLPKGCPCELVGVGYDMYCTFAYGVPSRVREYYECCEKETRPGWCPLVPVPPHGDLIDRDALIKYLESDVQTTGVKVTKEYLRFAPTILEADGKDVNVTTKESGT